MIDEKVGDGRDGFDSHVHLPLFLDQDTPDPQTNNKEGRRLDIFRNLNSLETNIKKHHTTSESAKNTIDEHKAVVKSYNETETEPEVINVETAILKKIEAEILNTSTNKTNDKTERAKVIEYVTEKEEVEPGLTTDSQDISYSTTIDTNTEPFTLATAVITQETTVAEETKDETINNIETTILPDNITDYNNE